MAIPVKIISGKLKRFSNSDVLQSDAVSATTAAPLRIQGGAATAGYSVADDSLFVGPWGSRTNPGSGNLYTYGKQIFSSAATTSSGNKEIAGTGSGLALNVDAGNFLFKVAGAGSAQIDRNGFTILQGGLVAYGAGPPVDYSVASYSSLFYNSASPFGWQMNSAYGPSIAKFTFAGAETARFTSTDLAMATSKIISWPSTTGAIKTGTYGLLQIYGGSANNVVASFGGLADGTQYNSDCSWEIGRSSVDATKPGIRTSLNTDVVVNTHGSMVVRADGSDLLSADASQITLNKLLKFHSSIGTPSNTSSPESWVPCKKSDGTSGYIPLYK